MIERPWTIKETAVQLGLPENTLRWYLYKGTAPTNFLLGGRRVFKPSDVEAWVEKQYAASSRGASVA